MSAATWVAAAAVLGLASACGSNVPEPPKAADATRLYVALGDSYTSGPGIPDVISSPCFRSDHNYPHLVADGLDNTDLVDVSCAGARTRGMTQKQDTGLSVEDPQLDVLTADTDLVTLGIGANDDHYFSDVVVGCTVMAEDAAPDGSPCRDKFTNSEGHDELRSLAIGIQHNIQAVLERIAELAPDARILLVGYPQVVPAHGTCDALPLAAADYPFVRRAFGRIIEAQRRAAAAADVEYIDVESMARGHDICSRDPWMAGVEDHAGEASAWHPYEVEHQEVAAAILHVLDSDPGGSS
jgi:lysophospholipase L1-like esterase